MVTYEITAQVRGDLLERYETYMRERHIRDVLATGFFSAASFSRAGIGRYRIRYEAPDKESLDAYLREFAGPLRQHFTEHFPEGIELSRENWTVLQQWSSESHSGA
jgi:hypothetical protein